MKIINKWLFVSIIAVIFLGLSTLKPVNAQQIISSKFQSIKTHYYFSYLINHFKYKHLTVRIEATPSSIVTEGTKVSLNANVNLKFHNLKYTWSGDCKGNSSTYIFPSDTPAGKYSCKVSVRSGFQVANSKIVIIIKPIDTEPQVTISVSPGSEVLEGTKVDFTANVKSGNSPFTYSWSGEGCSVGSDDNISYIFPTAGSYNCSVSVKDKDGDVATAIQTIVVKPKKIIRLFSGMAYDDENLNGDKDLEEVGVRNVKIWLDVNNNWKYDEGIDPYCNTDQNGYFEVDALLNQGTYNLIADIGNMTDWNIELPSEGYYTINVNEHWEYALHDFLMYKSLKSDISVIPGTTVKEGTEVKLQGKYSGNDYNISYNWSGACAGDSIEFLLPSNTPAGTYSCTFTVRNQLEEVSSTVEIIIEPDYRKTITGKFFEDKNINEIIEPGEEGISNQTVFLDLNGNYIYDEGVDLATTSDMNGDYQFKLLLPAGTYLIQATETSIWSIYTPLYFINVTDNSDHYIRNFSTYRPLSAHLQQGSEITVEQGVYTNFDVVIDRGFGPYSFSWSQVGQQDCPYALPSSNPNVSQAFYHLGTFNCFVQVVDWLGKAERSDYYIVNFTLNVIVPELKSAVEFDQWSNIHTGAGETAVVGQSFTMLNTGYIGSVDLCLNLATADEVSASIYYGESFTAGNLKAVSASTQILPETCGGKSNWYRFTFNNYQGLLYSGYKYTISIQNVGGVDVYGVLSDTDLYSGGRSYYINGWENNLDYLFRVYTY